MPRCLIELALRAIPEIFSELSRKAANVLLTRDTLIVFGKTSMRIGMSNLEERLNTRPGNAKSTRRKGMISSRYIDFLYQSLGVAHKG